MPSGRAMSGWFRRPTTLAVATVFRSSLPPLAVGPQIELVRPAVSRLVVQCPVGFSNGARLDQAVRRKLGHYSGGGAEAPADRLAVDRAVDDQMGDVNILRCKLARHGLCHRAQTELRRRKRGEAGAAAHAGGGAGKQDRATGAWHHVARCFAAGQKAAIAGEFPYPRKQLGIGLDQRRLDVGAGVEEANFDRPQLCLDLCEKSAWTASSLRTSVLT